LNIPKPNIIYKVTMADVVNHLPSTEKVGERRAKNKMRGKFGSHPLSAAKKMASLRDEDQRENLSLYVEMELNAHDCDLDSN
jgi:hypothetical protein